LRGDPSSILALYRRLIALRSEHLALSIGDYMPGGVQGNIFWFERRHGHARLIVALNFGHAASAVPLSRNGQVLLSTHLDRESERIGTELVLRPDEGIIVGD
jgi:alpha-glucosidase